MQQKQFQAGDITLYSIYPRSFYDSNGDGIGDLRGIIQKLDYLNGKKSSLGINAIWLNPFYPSPMADFGYDVSNYCDVDPIFGTLQDFDELLEGAHARGIKVFIDFVPNHTSDHHPWFEESRSSRKNSKRDWYIWHDPKPDGSPPNNWLSEFGGSAWEFDNNTNQYYLHSFLKSQPDLNWENPDVRRAMGAVMRFWLDRGVDGFRIDSVQFMGKDTQFRDDPPNPDYNKQTDEPKDRLLHVHSKRDPIYYSYLKTMTAVTKKYPRRLLIAELYPHRRFGYTEYLDLYENVDPSLLVPFNFEGIFVPWEAQSFKRFVDGLQARLQPGYLPVYAMSNQDHPRIVARFGLKEARIVAMLQLTLPGIPVIYYGDEIGMSGGPADKTHAKDPLARLWQHQGSRDPERTPMQWTPGHNSGFSEAGETWLPVGDHRSVNVETELAGKDSLLNLYRTLLALRNKSEALRQSAYRPLECYYNDLFAFIREYGDERIAVVLNFSNTKAIECPIQGKTLISTASDQPTGKNMQPLEGRIIKLTSTN